MDPRLVEFKGGTFRVSGIDKAVRSDERKEQKEEHDSTLVGFNGFEAILGSRVAIGRCIATLKFSVNLLAKTLARKTGSWLK
jgi:hypothetical protein